MLAFEPMKSGLYSVRMHASRGGRHLSGAERLVEEDLVEETTAQLLQRALSHSQGRAESVRLSVDLVDPKRVRYGRLPDVRTFEVSDVDAGRDLALSLLCEAGVGDVAARSAMTHLIAGAAPDGSSMRGAMLVGHRSGERFEPDRTRGVRASHMDISDRARSQLEKALRADGIRSDRLPEALVLAAKVISAPGVFAELCWSDDPDYLTGYVATAQLGYVRITPLKQRGDMRGGRAFFVDEDRWQAEALLSYLRDDVFLADEVGRILPGRDRR